MTVMKKLLTLFLVLAMASLASAAFELNIQIDPDGPEGEIAPFTWVDEDVHPSDWIYVDLLSDVPISLGMLNTRMNFSNGDMMYDLEWVQTGWLAHGGDIRSPSEGDPPYDPALTGFDAFFNGSVFMQPYPEGWIYTVWFHVPDYKEASDIIVIDAYEGTWNGVVAQLGPEDLLPFAVIHVIPEPMTIALLGLGGLFLVRKRRK
jgi:hypothetical protein